MKAIALVLFAAASIAFVFLLYTLLNLGKLGIGIAHPRVLVEAGLGVVFLAAGLLLLFLSR